VSEVAAVIRNELDRWGVAEVERLLFATVDAADIADMVSEFCLERFGHPAIEGLFYRGSVGAVFGLGLADGNRVVLKVYQSRWSERFLRAVQAVRARLAAEGFPCAEPLLGPLPLSARLKALVTAERLLPDPGLRPLSGDGDRAASAGGLAEQIRRCVDLNVPGLDGHPLRTPESGLYPEPHSPIFDFTSTSQGAQWIDRLARRAAQLRGVDLTPQVAAHMDWSARNVRVQDGAVVATYDWDSIALAAESTAIGQAAVTWSVTSEPGGNDFPDAGQIANYARDYERSAGRTLTPGQWAAVGASTAWLLAYTARCEHALQATGIARPDQHGARERLASEGETLLTLSRADTTW
jgi:hypothetical protein